MADSFTNLLRFRQQTTGANNNVWGALLNAAVFQLVEDSLAGRVQKVVAGVDITLSTNNGSSDEARMSTISLTGAPGATRNIIIPNLAKWYIVENLTNAAQRIKTAAMLDEDGYLVSVNDRKIVMCDGADGVFGVADTLGGLDASAFARRAERNSFSAGNADVPVQFTDGATITFDTEDANVWFGTLGGNRTVALTNQVDGSWLDLYFTQDGTGGRVISTWPANIVWDDGEEPQFPGTPNTTDLVQLRWIEDLALWFGRHTATLNAPGGGSLVALEFTTNEMCVDAYARAGSPAGPVTLTVRIPAGVLIYSLVTGTPALDFEGFASGSIINLINEGHIQGAGGEGGDGGVSATMSGADPLRIRGRPGEDAGDAIRGPSTACDVNITNANGFIWGGGGGGGGGGGTADNGDGDWSAGGGGGGGAGGGRRGQGGSMGSSTATSATVRIGESGESGSIGPNGTFGTGGLGDEVNAATGGPGGDGGDWGSSGAAGTSPTTGAQDSPGGPGGAAGKAYNQNGGSPVNFVSGNSSPHVEGATV
jgi:hypothetical protein